MAIAFDATATFTPPDVEPYVPAPGIAAWNHTCAADSYLLAFLWAISDFNFSASYDDVEMLPLHYQNNNYKMVGFKQANPASGVNEVEILWTQVAGEFYEAVGISISLTGVDQTVQHGTVVAASGDSSTDPEDTPTITVETAAGEVVVIVCGTGAAEPGTGVTERDEIVSFPNGFGRLYIATSTQAVNTYVQSVTGRWSMIAVSLKPVGAAGTRPVPGIELWRDRMLTGIEMCEGVLAGYTDWVANEEPNNGAVVAIWAEQGPYSWYYDHTKCAYKIADDMENRGVDSATVALFRESAWKNLFVVDAAYYQVTGYFASGWRYFTDGPLMDYQYRGDLNSKAIILALRDTTPYGQEDVLAPYETQETSNLERELAYQGWAHLNAVLAGHAPRTERYALFADWGYEYFDRWFVTFDWELPGSVEHYAPFLVGLLAHFLIRDHKITGDVRLQPALVLACDWLIANAWHAEDIAHTYSLNPESAEGLSDYGSPDLNNLIAHMFAYTALLTGDEDYMLWADKLFAGSALNGGFYDGVQGKQFNQRHMLAFEYLDYRSQFYAAPTVRRRGGMRRRII
jgi:hypothetical protein